MQCTGQHREKFAPPATDKLNIATQHRPASFYRGLDQISSKIRNPEDLQNKLQNQMGVETEV